MPMHVNWEEVPDSTGYAPIPDGEYLMAVDSIQEKQTAKGDTMWALTLVVKGEQHNGRKIFDNLTWSTEGLKRVKFVLRRLGLELSGEQEVTMEDVIGRSAYVTVFQDSYFSEKHQREMKKNSVPFDGYRKAEGGAATASVTESKDVPF